MSDEFEYDIYISYNSDDRERARRLAERLRDAGLRVWFDEWVIRPGDVIYLKIDHGLLASRVLVLCMSPAAFNSGWVDLERSTVLFRNPTNEERRFIPLLIADCRIPDTVRRYRYIDYRDEGAAAFEELLSVFRPEAERTPGGGEERPGREQEAAGPPPMASLEREIANIESFATSLAFSPDGEVMVSGTDTTVKVWDVETGECRATLKGHRYQVMSVAVTHDGRLLLSASLDRDIRVWELETGREVRKLPTGYHSVMCVAPLPAGGEAVSCSGGGENLTLQLWEVETGRLVKSFGSHAMAAHSLAVVGQRRQVVTGSEDAALRLWDVETGKCLLTLKGHAGRVNSVQVTPDGRYAVSGSDDRTVKIWDLKKGVCFGTLEGHQSKIDSVAVSADGTLVASTGFLDKTVRLWNWRSGTCVQVLEVRDFPVAVSFSPNGRHLLAGMTNGRIYVYRLAGAKAALPAEATRRYVNAKVVLLGESGAGKSALAHRLIEDEFVQTHSTHGMHVWRLDLPLEQKEGAEREALLWDLAGQEDYRLIHRLFLDETALALVLFNPQKEDPFAELGDWLKGLSAATKHRRHDVAKLLVAARVDVGGARVSRKKIESFMEEHDFAGYVATSAARGDNCSDKGNGGLPSELKKLIAGHIPWDGLPWTSTPKLLADVKSAVLDMAEKKEIRLLRFAELCQRLEQALPGHSIGESDARTAVTLLANHGLVMPLDFGELVLLRPDLMHGYASAVIRAARAHTDEIGSVREAEVYAAGFDFSGVDRLDRPDEELLLRAMVLTFIDRSLCIAEDTPDGSQLIFPSQYRRERPIPAYPEVFVSYTFSGELQTIYTTLVVRLWYSRLFDQKELWRNAAEFVTTRGRTVGLVMERQHPGEGEGTISVFFETGVPDEMKVVFIEFVHRHLERYARDVRRDRRYVCPECAKAVTDLGVVRERLAAGRDFIYCQGCDHRVPLIDHIEQRLGTDPVARKVRQMEERDRRERDTQALAQMLFGHLMAVCGEANQIFRPVAANGLDGEVEFKDRDGNPSGKKVYVQLSSGAVYQHARDAQGRDLFDIKDERYLEYLLDQRVDIYLVVRDAHETFRWMNVTQHLRLRMRKSRQPVFDGEQADAPGKTSRHFVFSGERLDAPAVWRVRDEYFPRPVAS